MTERSKLVSVRIPAGTYDELHYFAEQRNMNLSDLLRHCCNEYLDLEKDKIALKKLKGELTQNIFTMLIATINLPPAEREETAKLINFELKEEVVK